MQANTVTMTEITEESIEWTRQGRGGWIRIKKYGGKKKLVYHDWEKCSEMQTIGRFKWQTMELLRLRGASRCGVCRRRVSIDERIDSMGDSFTLPEYLDRYGGSAAGVREAFNRRVESGGLERDCSVVPFIYTRTNTPIKAEH